MVSLLWRLSWGRQGLGVAVVGLLACRVVVGVVFALAAAAKLADRVGARRALVDFGIPERFASPGAVLLPLAELGVAGALLVGPFARPGAAGALALLVVFSLAVALNLAAGRKMDCHCFGQLHSSPIGAATLVRNGLLGVLSTLVVVEGPGLGVGDALDLGLARGLALASAAAFVAWRFLAALRQQGPLLLHPDVPEPSFEGPAADLGPVHHGPGAIDATPLSRRRALALLAMTVVGATVSLRPTATACGAECRSSSDCPGTCTNCKKRPGEMTGHCH